MAQTYLITGTSRGIGLEMTQQLLRKGNTVLALARHPDQSDPLKKLKTEYPDQIRVYSVDVTSDSNVSALVKELGSNMHIDVLVNNAGVYGKYTTNLEDLCLDSVLEILSVNAVAPIRMTRALLPFLRKSDEPKVVNITSLMGSIADNESGGSYGYRMSKTALNMFHKTFSVDYQDIVSLVIHPGWVKTDMGGSEAPIEPSVSVQGILSVIEKATIKHSGKFLDYEGDELPW